MPWLLFGLIGAAIAIASTKPAAAVVAIKAGSRVLLTLSHSLMTAGDRQAFERDLESTAAANKAAMHVNALHFTDDRLELDLTYGKDTQIVRGQTIIVPIAGGGTYTVTVRDINLISKAA